MIAPDGMVTRVTPLREVAGLTDAAVDALRKWRFARTCVGDRPAPLIEAIAVSYGVDPPEAGR